jgi:hypothetical protein
MWPDSKTTTLGKCFDAQNFDIFLSILTNQLLCSKLDNMAEKWTKIDEKSVKIDEK